MARLMNLMIDYAFKKVFGKPGNEPILMAFLNAALQPPAKERIMWLTLQNTEQGREHEDDKKSILDILAKTAQGSYINVEIQLANYHDMDRRTLFYWSKVYANQMKAGMIYQELAPTITINIVNFRYLLSTKRYHTTFHVREDEENFLLTDVLEVHFMELPKLMDQWEKGEASPEENHLVRWLLLLEAEEHEDIRDRLEEIAMQDEAMKQAFVQWEEVSQDAESWIAYEQRRKVVLDEMSRARSIELRESTLEQQRLDMEQQRLDVEQKQEELEKKQIEIEHKEIEIEHKEIEIEHKEIEIEQERLAMEQTVKRAQEEGKEKNLREMAQRMMTQGMALSLVSQITGLSIGELEQMARTLN